jgi:hypothetical protein
VSRSVDDVQLVLVPETGRGSGLNGDPALLLLFHEIRRGGTIVHFPHLVDFPGQLEDALGRRSLPGVNVREDANVTVFGKVSHG